MLTQHRTVASGGLEPVWVWPLTEVVQQLLGSVLRGLEIEQFLILVDELRVHGGVEELVVGQDILQEGDVGLETETQTEQKTPY